jgi:hypothetical protein
MVLSQKPRYKDNETKDPGIKPHYCSHLILTKEPKIYTGEKSASSTNGAGKTGYLHVED